MSEGLKERLSFEKKLIEEMSTRRDSLKNLHNNIDYLEYFTTEEKKMLTEKIQELDGQIQKKTDVLNTKTSIYETKIKVLSESLHTRESLINNSIGSLPDCDDIMQIFAKQQSTLTSQLNKCLQQIEE